MNPPAPSRTLRARRSTRLKKHWPRYMWFPRRPIETPCTLSPNSPLNAIIDRGVAQPGRALLSGGRGRRFKSSHPDHDSKLFSQYVSPNEVFHGKPLPPSATSLRRRSCGRSSQPRLMRNPVGRRRSRAASRLRPMSAQPRQRARIFALQKLDERLAHPATQVSTKKTNSSSSAMPVRPEAATVCGACSIQPDGTVFSGTRQTRPAEPDGDMTLDRLSDQESVRPWQVKIRWT